MDYEKKYKDALSWIKDVYPTFEGALKEDAEHFFPELKESNDKRIKEAIRYAIASSTHEDGTLINGVTESEAIAWLEKQGEQKVSIVDFKAEDWYVSKVDGKIHYMKYNPNKGLVWSEEDERIHNASIRACQYMVEHFENSTKDYEDAIEWFNSLKGRLQPQWEPSDEQIAALRRLANSGKSDLYDYRHLKRLLEQLEKL